MPLQPCYLADALTHLATTTIASKLGELVLEAGHTDIG